MFHPWDLCKISACYIFFFEVWATYGPNPSDQTSILNMSLKPNLSSIFISRTMFTKVASFFSPFYLFLVFPWVGFSSSESTRPKLLSPFSIFFTNEWNNNTMFDEVLETRNSIPSNNRFEFPSNIPSNKRRKCWCFFVTSISYRNILISKGSINGFLMFLILVKQMLSYQDSFKNLSYKMRAIIFNCC